MSNASRTAHGTESRSTVGASYSALTSLALDAADLARLHLELAQAESRDWAARIALPLAVAAGSMLTILAATPVALLALAVQLRQTWDWPWPAALLAAAGAGLLIGFAACAWATRRLRQCEMPLTATLAEFRYNVRQLKGSLKPSAL